MLICLLFTSIPIMSSHLSDCRTIDIDILSILLEHSQQRRALGNNRHQVIKLVLGGMQTPILLSLCL